MESETIRVEFSSESSGAYIHEMTDDITLDLETHKLRVHKNPSHGNCVDIDLTYPDGTMMTLESIVVKEN